MTYFETTSKKLCHKTPNSSPKIAKEPTHTPKKRAGITLLKKSATKIETKGGNIDSQPHRTLTSSEAIFFWSKSNSNWLSDVASIRRYSKFSSLLLHTVGSKKKSLIFN